MAGAIRFRKPFEQYGEFVFAGPFKDGQYKLCTTCDCGEETQVPLTMEEMEAFLKALRCVVDELKGRIM